MDTALCTLAVDDRDDGPRVDGGTPERPTLCRDGDPDPLPLATGLAATVRRAQVAVL